MKYDMKKVETLYGNEFISEFAERTGMDHTAAKKTVIAFLDLLVDSWNHKQSVTFRGFGTFGLRPTSERMARNPRTMEDYLIPSGYKPELKISKGLRTAINDTIRENTDDQ